MAKKKDEKDVLVVRDEKTGEISVVAGLNADGSPSVSRESGERAEFPAIRPARRRAGQLLQELLPAVQEPSRFGFYRVAADQADKLLEVIGTC